MRYVTAVSRWCALVVAVASLPAAAQPSRTFDLLTASVADIQAAVDAGRLTYEQVDALVHPFKSLGAPPIGTGDRGPRDNPVSAITGLPAIVVPAGVDAEGLPISIEFLGRPFSEPTLLNLAFAYEQASHRRTAPGSTPHLAGEVFPY